MANKSSNQNRKNKYAAQPAITKANKERKAAKRQNRLAKAKLRKENRLAKAKLRKENKKQEV